MHFLLKFMLNRLREPSSWAGLAVIITQAGWSTQVAEAATAAAAATIALIAVALPSGK